MRKEQKGIKVLHVDNEPDFLALTKAFLERENENFSVDTATSAEEAIALLKGGKYDVVVSDYLIPVMDGLEFLKTLRASGNTIPFIMFTGKGREEVAIEALNRGTNGYLQKGTDIESMFGTLTHVIRAEVAKTRAEDALQESEKHFRALIENSSDIIQIVDSEGVIRYVSPSVQQILGYKPEELIGRLSIDVVHLDDLPKVARGFEKALQEPEVPVIVECRCKHKNGAWRIIEGIGVNRLDDPSVNGFISNMHDITERKQAEEELQESKERLHTVVSNAPGVIWALDKDGIFTLSEGRGLKALGLRPGEVVGKSVFDVYRDVPKIIENNRRALTGESFVSIVEAGELIFESYYSPIQDKNGEVIGMIGVSNDITERKAVENALQESEEKYRTVFENTGTATVIIEEDTTISLANKSFENLSVFSREEIEGKKCWTEFVVKEDLERMKQQHSLRRKDSEAALKNYEFRFVDREGKVKDILLTIDMIPGTTKSVASLLDITERKQVEDALQKAEQEKTAILYSMSELVAYQDTEMRVLWANRAAGESVGLAPEELIGRLCYEIWHQRSEPCVDCPVVRARETSQPQEAEMTTPDGRIWLIRGYPVRDANGDIIGVVETTLEITERKRVEEKLAKIVDGVNIPAFAINKEHKITHWNTALESVTEESREEVVGTDKQWTPFYVKKRPVMADLIVDEAPESEFKDWYGDKYKKSSLIEGAYEALDFFLMLEEEGKWLLFTAAPLRDSEGTIIGAIETLQDITERKRSEVAFLESEEKYRTLIETITDIIFTLDLGGNFTYLSPQLEKITDYSIRDLLGHSFTEVLAPEYIESTVDRFKRGLAGETIPLYDVEFMLSDGRRLPLELNVTALRDAEDRTIGRLGVARDITERKKAENALRESENKYRTIFETTGTAAVIVEEDMTPCVFG